LRGERLSLLPRCLISAERERYIRFVSNEAERVLKKLKPANINWIDNPSDSESSSYESGTSQSGHTDAITINSNEVVPFDILHPQIARAKSASFVVISARAIVPHRFGGGPLIVPAASCIANHGRHATSPSYFVRGADLSITECASYLRKESHSP